MLTEFDVRQLRPKGFKTPYWQRRLEEIAGAKGPVAKEKRAVLKLAMKEPAPKARKDAWQAPSQRVVLAFLRDGRAHFEGDIRAVTGLCAETITSILSRLRRRGEVEQHYVGTFRLWSRTMREAE